ncbi:MULTISPECIES: iron ABC transporter permease [unclassified Oceanispirochaeta]|uniref:FecCD family ABC transporter permease n=1 Tax=unclassified Oceanispirochaeta TaxID=2635722 RepID=UPI000E097932|nr:MULTISPECIES: iron ABC transporter permease [unclassified Oceanispirochaeta]MBF9015926.1 iron ABC transporter permease [Oceanispirochaeta sp. M2]NPD72389.1 iron ABC transporter permease [Oceanispirochaeta sp. M1]RDG32160.1 iron ABC transporter permease [Oceanispirochaeta sp. M1]
MINPEKSASRIPGITLFFLLITLLILASSIGAVSLPFSGLIRYLFSGGKSGLNEGQEIILMQIRVPRVLMAALAGAGLSLSGLVFQAIFRNPMAEPYLLGVASGASLGASLYMMIGLPAFFISSLGLTAAAFLGSLLSVFLILSLASRNGNNISSLLLAGVAFSSIAQAGVSIMMMLNREKVERIVFWTLGSFSSAHMTKVILLLIVLIPSSLFIIFRHGELDLLSLGHEEAHSLGINPERVSLQLLLVSCLITAVIVSNCGIIGFAGLLVPHFMRLISGPGHRNLTFLSIMGGAILMILSDLLARTIIAPAEIPVGVVTALTGGPFFLYLLRRNSGKVM